MKRNCLKTGSCLLFLVVWISSPAHAMCKWDVQSYNHGKYSWQTHEASEDPDTACKTIGKNLGKRKPGDGYWIVLDSWGKTWGEKGFFKIKRGTCGIEKPATVAICGWKPQ